MHPCGAIMKTMKPWLTVAAGVLFYWLALPALLNLIGLHAMAHYLQWWKS
jgi:hypothetical protein